MPDQKSILKRCTDWVKRQLIDRVPAEVALCEFDCRKGQCVSEEWETCTRRLNKGTGQYPLIEERSSNER